jgi:uncharacterized protein (TIGR03067 family)
MNRIASPAGVERRPVLFVPVPVPDCLPVFLSSCPLLAQEHTIAAAVWGADRPRTGRRHTPSEGRMKAIALTLGLAACAALSAGAADEKIDLAGKYTLVSGKKNGAAVDDSAKKAKYSATADKFTIDGGDMKFVMSYKLDTKASPVAIDMEILEGPEGTKGSKAVGIVEMKGDILKLAYSLDKEKRPKNFEGKDGFYMELKKQKD